MLNNFFLTFNTLLRIDPWRLVDKDNKKQLLGGELCAWSEMNNEYNLPTKLFPRGAAMSFRLWNPNASYSNAKVAEMLIKHQYRLNAYGVPHQRVKFYANWLILPHFIKFVNLNFLKCNNLFRWHRDIVKNTPIIVLVNKTLH